MEVEALEELVVVVEEMAAVQAEGSPEGGGARKYGSGK
ncbi:unnamed protein product [Cuscuta epithymum]|uniref:Uncharacterized protein n=1 Tax=Cuscuta epithymum TaxID=186058 RepID=A0AAV0CCG7_9ASTE|nr:unnamed protein product [Cuscuta epithymum]CAH9146574.1 unnamed protein product [Cuscuta epithymum]